MPGQTCSIDWHKITGGGGTSTGSVYSVSGTIGQPDAGTVMAGGNYSVTGGFWSLFAVETPGAPVVKILLMANHTAAVSWPYPSTGWNLQQNSSLGISNWAAPTETIQNDGTNNFIIVSPPAGNRFYRLEKASMP